MDNKDIKLQELSNNQEFIKKLMAVNSVDEAKEVFVEYGVDVSDDEINELRNQVKVGLHGELNEAELEKAAGGEAKLMYKCSCGMYFVFKAMAKRHDKAWGAGHELLPGKYSPFIWF